MVRPWSDAGIIPDKSLSTIKSSNKININNKEVRNKRIRSFVKRSKRYRYNSWIGKTYRDRVFPELSKLQALLESVHSIDCPLIKVTKTIR